MISLQSSPYNPIALAPAEALVNAEFELKFTTDAAGIGRVLSLKVLEENVFSRKQRVRTTYYDTPDGRLLQLGMSLRIRQSGRKRPVQTFKAPTLNSSSALERVEIEVPAGPNGLDLKSFDPLVQEIIGKATHGAPLEERYKTDFHRRATLALLDRSHIEIAIDAGHFLANGQLHPLHEVEFELKSGERAEAIGFAKDIALAAGLRLEFVSKAERCALFAGMIIPDTRSGRAILSGLSLDASIVVILSESLQHFLDYIRPFRDERSPHSIHQMRVGLRRLRAALKMLGKAFPETTLISFGDRARILATGLGEARDCDAFQELAFGESLAHRSRPTDSEHLKTGLETLRAEAYENASALIESGETLSFILDMQAYLARRGWRSEAIDAHFPILSGPAETFARDVLADLFKRVRKRGKGLLQRSDEERHEFRITLKNLRYNASFLAPLFDAPKIMKLWLSELGQLQDLLGLQNDLANAQIMLERISTFTKEPFPKAAGFVLGWHACQSDAADKRIDKAWKKLKAHKTFWI
jgi:inorganic triphosphatase YgiF